MVRDWSLITGRREGGGGLQNGRVEKVLGYFFLQQHEVLAIMKGVGGRNKFPPFKRGWGGGCENFKPIFHQKLRSRWLPTANEIDTNNMKCRWLTRVDQTHWVPSCLVPSRWPSTCHVVRYIHVVYIILFHLLALGSSWVRGDSRWVRGASR